MQQHERVHGLKGSWDWLGYAASLPGKPVPLLSSSGTFTPFPGRCIYLGVNLINSGTAAGRVIAYDGLDATGPVIDVAAIPASGIVSAGTTASGVLCENGVTLAVTGATVIGSVIVIPLWHYPWTPPGE